MATNSKKSLGLAQGNKNSHIFTEFEQLNKESTQLQVLEAIKGIQINVGDIIVGDITVESSDTGTHTRLDTANTHLNDITITSSLSAEKLGEMTFTSEDALLKLEVKDSTTNTALVDTNSKLDDINTELDTQTTTLQSMETTLQNSQNELENVNTNLLTIDENITSVTATTAITEIKYIKTRNIKDASVESWINNTTLTTGQTSSSLDVSNFGRDSFISYSDTNTGDTTSIAIKSNGAIIGVLNPKDNPSGTYRFAYSHLNLSPFTEIELENWNNTSLDIVNVSVFSG